MATQRIEVYTPQQTLIMLDPTMDRIRKHKRCDTCGNIVFDYYGGIKLIMPCEFDYWEDGRTKDDMTGEEVDWFETLGVPYPIECSGRLTGLRKDGSTTKVRCKQLFFKIGG